MVRWFVSLGVLSNQPANVWGDVYKRQIPAIELIRQVFPQARITLLGPSFLKELFEYDPRISYIIVSNKRKKNYFRNIFVILRNKMCIRDRM